MKFIRTLVFTFTLAITSVAHAGVNVWTTHGPSFGGSVTTLAIDPTTPTTLYAGTDSGVFKSTDGGTTWDASNAPGVPVFDPLTPSTLYAVTPQSCHPMWGCGGGGVSESSDGGATWGPTGLTDASVQALAIDPHTPSTLYAGSDAGVLQSTDSGGSWTAVNSGLYVGVSALAIDPQMPTTLYAGTDSGIFKSTDSGGNWSPANTGLTDLGVGVLAIDPKTPSTLYAETGSGIFKSTDSGGSWSPANTGLTNLDMVLAIDPKTPSTLYVETGAGVFKSTDSGGSWGPTGLTDAGVRALAIDPNTASTLYAGAEFSYPNPGGVFKSTNSGDSWSGPASIVLVYPSVATLAIDPNTPSTLYAGAGADGVFKSTDSGGSWSPANSGVTDGFVNALAIDPKTPSTLYAGTQRGGGIFKSTDSGSSWGAANTGLPPLPYSGVYPSVTTLAIDPEKSYTLYAVAGGAIFQSTDGGYSWGSPAGPTLAVQALAIAPAPSATPNPLPVPTPVPWPEFHSTVYAGTSGGVFKSTNGTSAPTITDQAKTCMHDCEVTADNAASACVDDPQPFSCVDGATRQLYACVQECVSWNKVNSGFNVYTLALDPSTPSTLYAGGNGGVLKSTDSGGSWSPVVNTGLTNTNVLALAIDPKTRTTLYAGTGGGVFDIELVGPSCIGDCDNDGQVTIDEILTMLSIALGDAGAGACVNGVPGDAEVDVALILQAVNNALSGCPLAPEQGCLTSGGTVTTAMCCASTDDFPDTCAIGACGCPPDASHEVHVCDCAAGSCFNGSGCVAH